METYEKKVDCKFYAEDGSEEDKCGCKILTERVCEYKNCTFYLKKTTNKK